MRERGREEGRKKVRKERRKEGWKIRSKEDKKGLGKLEENKSEYRPFIHFRREKEREGERVGFHSCIQLDTTTHRDISTRL